MPKIEVDEVEYNQSKQLREVIGKLMADPKRAAKIEELRKEIEPSAPTPHLDSLRLAREPVDEIRRELEEFKKQTAAERAESEKTTKLAALQAKVDAGNAKLLQEGWTADGIKTLTEFREKEGILDPIHAAAVYEKLNGAQVAPMQPSSGVGGWNFLEPAKEGPDADNLKKLLETRGESDSLTMKMAHDALNDFRGQVKGFGR